MKFGFPSRLAILWHNREISLYPYFLPMLLGFRMSHVANERFPPLVSSCRVIDILVQLSPLLLRYLPMDVSCSYFPGKDGALLVPAVLAIHIPASAYGLTGAEWLNLAGLTGEHESDTLS